MFADRLEIASESHARALDRADPLASFRER
ncbi:MAG: hypothetical protein QOF01_217, partial [Thermomicrobiales bacterium]|nr:hypothetical protein [Thermomicrobiales bacterium]